LIESIAAMSPLSLKQRTLKSREAEEQIAWVIKQAESGAAGVSDTSFSGRLVVLNLAELIGLRGRPGTMVSDNGPGLISNTVLARFGKPRAEWYYTAPGIPPQNPLFATVNGRLGAELNGQGLFCTAKPDTMLWSRLLQPGRVQHRCRDSNRNWMRVESRVTMIGRSERIN
jgi:hypothetical protein